MTWIVEWQETDKNDFDYGKWFKLPLEMCTKDRHCGCGDREAGLENCDNFYYDTDEEQRAIDVYNQEKPYYQNLRICKVESSKKIEAIEEAQ
jgi:hypothetical protein